MNDERGFIVSHGERSEGETQAVACVVQQTCMARDINRTLAVDLMERVCTGANLNQAYKRVKRNKGAPGIDGMTVDELGSYIDAHKEELIASLLDGSYKPQPVRRVMIPKRGGGERQLGIPTVIDRLVQQAILQVLDPIYEPRFSESSFGFRRGRSAHDAVKQAKRYVEAGYEYVVDLDLEKFFDRVNHDILMSRLARVIGDKRLLKIIRGYLTSGIMQDGVVITRHEGTPQGGPLSPLLSNILLDELDKELEKRGHKFCRYADDQNIYVRSKQAGERVYASVKRFLETKLRLKVNDEKSAVAQVTERKFLGYRLSNEGRLTVSPAALTQAKERIRSLCQRSRGRSMLQVIRELNQYLRGWLNYYRLAENRSLWSKLDSWIRRKLRCYRLKQCKKSKAIVRLLVSRGVSEIEARKTGSSGKGWWRLSQTRAVHRALDNAWFANQGFIGLYEQWVKLLKA